MKSDSNLFGEIIDFTECELALKKMYCDVPKRPSAMVFTEECINEHLKYAGRFNYNKAIDDCLEQLHFLKK